MEEVVVMLEKQVTNWGMKITVLLYKFQLCLLADINDSIGSGVAILLFLERSMPMSQVMSARTSLRWTQILVTSLSSWGSTWHLPGRS
jgi:hypothetical protein